MTDQEQELVYARLRIAELEAHMRSIRDAHDANTPHHEALERIDHIAKRALACSIDELPTEAERAAARRVVAILAPMSPEERRRVAERYIAREDGEAKFREIFGKE